jgi:hypothetical protein
MYTVNVFEAATKLKELSWIGKKLFGSRITQVRKLQASRQNAYDILKPEIIRRREAEQNARDKGG